MGFTDWWPLTRNILWSLTMADNMLRFTDGKIVWPLTSNILWPLGKGVDCMLGVIEGEILRPLARRWVAWKEMSGGRGNCGPLTREQGWNHRLQNKRKKFYTFCAIMYICVGSDYVCFILLFGM